MNKKLNELKKLSETFQVSVLANVVLNDNRFPLWSGSGELGQHHYGDGGLLHHTHEVVTLALHNYAFFKNEYKDLSEAEIYLAALFHDYGKCWDYRASRSGSWYKTDHVRTIHHISRSAIEWSKAYAAHPDPNITEEHITHAILSHHGGRQYGSPVSPRNRLAWLLFLCDNMSARLNDAYTWDIIKKTTIK